MRRSHASLLVAMFLLLPSGSCLGDADLGRPAEVLSWRHVVLPQEEYERLAKEWEAFVARNPDDVRARVEWGKALWYGQKYEEARAIFARAYEMGPNEPAAIVEHASRNLIQLHDKADWGQAHTLHQQAARIDPAYPVTYYTLWLTSLHEGDEATAGACLRKVVELGDIPRPLFDYGYNMIAGAPENAIVFTNGDNDTYPPLAVQEITGLRPDVSIVSLSLLNAKWYVHHMRSKGLPVGLSDAEIDALEHKPDRTVSAQVQESLFRALDGAGWPRPLCYAVSVAEQNKVLPCARVLEGLQERLRPDEQATKDAEPAFDAARTRELLDTVYRLDSITDPLVDWSKEATVARGAMNYVAILERLGTALFEATPRADGGPYLYRAIQILSFHREDGAPSILEQWEKLDPESALLARARELAAPGPSGR